MPDMLPKQGTHQIIAERALSYTLATDDDGTDLRFYLWVLGYPSNELLEPVHLSVVLLGQKTQHLVEHRHRARHDDGIDRGDRLDLEAGENVQGSRIFVGIPILDANDAVQRRKAQDGSGFVAGEEFAPFDVGAKLGCRIEPERIVFLVADEKRDDFPIC